MSEVYKWLKHLPGGLHLEKCSKEFESRGFRTRGSRLSRTAERLKENFERLRSNG